VLTDDAKTSSFYPTKNFGSSIALMVGSNAYRRFDGRKSSTPEIMRGYAPAVSKRIAILLACGTTPYAIYGGTLQSRPWPG
jgi:hypothetical protein